MRSCLALCDIGNTSLKIGFADAGGNIASYAFPTLPGSTRDSLGFTLLTAASHAGIEPQEIVAVAAASVVPALNEVLKGAARRYFDCEALFAPEDLPIPLENRYQRPGEVGADRLVGAFAARRAYPEAASLIVVDFGTALTFDCVSGNAYLGGLIFPGPLTAAAALSSNTARLPHVSLEPEDAKPLLGRDTATSIRHGLIFGFRAVTDGLCTCLRKQLSEPVVIIGTGGLASLINEANKIFDVVLPGLSLDGLLDLYRLRAVNK